MVTNGLGYPVSGGNNYIPDFNYTQSHLELRIHLVNMELEVNPDNLEAEGFLRGYWATEEYYKAEQDKLETRLLHEEDNRKVLERLLLDFVKDKAPHLKKGVKQMIRGIWKKIRNGSFYRNSESSPQYEQ